MTVVFHRLAILIICLLGFYVRAATERFIIYPHYGLSLRGRQQLTEKINKLARAQGNIYTSFRHGGIRFWCADLTEMAYKELLEDDKVIDIHVNKVAVDLFTENESSDKNGTYLFRPTSGMTPSKLSASEENIVYFTQKSPLAAELRALSQPAGSGSISHYPNYVYRVGRRPIYIYHVELGINQEHEDFRGRNIKWLYTDLSRAMHADTMTEAAAGGGHSTCTASKAVGNLYGASRSATLVVVKMPNLEEASVYEVLDTVIDDIVDRGRGGASVVSISWGSKERISLSWDTSPLLTRLVSQIDELRRMNVLFVCAAGNAAQQPRVRGGTRLYADTFPAWYVGQRASGPKRGHVAVGNSDINGMRYPSSQISGHPYQLQVYAPGVEITCASSTSLTGYATRTGTSFSAPLVAGVLADLLSTERFSDVVPFWWKRPGGEYVVWNLVDKAHNPPVFGGGNATLVNYTSPVLATTAFSNEQLDVSAE